MRWPAVFLTAFALCMFAANSLFCRIALGSGMVDAASYTTIRLASGAAVLLLLTAWRHRSLVVAGEWSSAFLLVLYALPFSFAYNGLTTGTGALILFGGVQLTMLLMAWRVGERPSNGQWIGLAIAIGGLVHLVLPGLQAPSPLPASMMAIAGAAWGLYTMRGKGTGDPLLRTAGNFARALPMVAFVSLITAPSAKVGWPGALWAVISGAIASGLGYFAWYAALKHLSATRASTVQLLVPILAAVAGVLVLAEPYGQRLAISSVLVLGGVGLSLQRTPK